MISSASISKIGATTDVSLGLTLFIRATVDMVTHRKNFVIPVASFALITGISGLFRVSHKSNSMDDIHNLSQRAMV